MNVVNAPCVLGVATNTKYRFDKISTHNFFSAKCQHNGSCKFGQKQLHDVFRTFKAYIITKIKTQKTKNEKKISCLIEKQNHT